MFSKYLEVSTVTKSSWLLLYRDVSAVRCKNHIERIGVLCR